MALEIGQVVGGSGVLPVQRGRAPDDAAPDNLATAPLPGQQAPPLTGVGGKAFSGEALQALQGAGESEGGAEGELSEEEQKVVDELKKRDQEVRRHEAAHAAVGGQYAGAPTFTYTQGPDGKRYATGGEVSIDTSPIPGDPEATARKADQIRAAALAPADPSGQDRAVAAAAIKMKLDAQAEAASQRREEAEAKEVEREERKADAPAPEIAGPKPPDAEGAEPGAPADGRAAAVAGAYSRTDDTVARATRPAANALSLVA
jgi:hypothetical protein